MENDLMEKEDNTRCCGNCRFRILHNEENPSAGGQCIKCKKRDSFRRFEVYDGWGMQCKEFRRKKIQILEDEKERVDA